MKIVEFGIYKWTNKINGKVLVGQTGPTQGFKKRKSKYLTALKANNYSNGYFQRSWNKYTGDIIEFSSVKEATEIGFKSKQLYKCLVDVNRTHLNFYWKYIDVV